MQNKAPKYYTKKGIAVYLLEHHQIPTDIALKIISKLKDDYQLTTRYGRQKTK